MHKHSGLFLVQTQTHPLPPSRPPPPPSLLLLPSLPLPSSPSLLGVVGVGKPQISLVPFWAACDSRLGSRWRFLGLFSPQLRNRMGSVSLSWQVPGDIFPALPYLSLRPLCRTAQYYAVPSRVMGSSEKDSLKRDSAFKRPVLLSSGGLWSTGFLSGTFCACCRAPSSGHFISALPSGVGATFLRS